MSFKDLFKKKLGKKKIPYARSPLYYSHLEEYKKKNRWISHNYKKSITKIEQFDVLLEAYKNPLIYSCINVIVKDVIDQNWKIVDTSLNVDDSDYCKYFERVLRRPLNDDVTFEEFLEQYLTSYFVTGNAFAERIRNEDNVLIGYNYIPPNEIEYDLEKEKFKYANTDFYFEKEDILHMYDKQIDNSPFGLSKIEVLASDISMELQVQLFNKKLIHADNLAPRGVLSFKSDMDSDEFDAEKQRLKSESENNEKRRGTLLVHGAEYTPINLTPQDLQYSELYKIIAQRIMAVFRVPPEKLQIIETANLGTGTGDSQNRNYLQNLSSLLKKIETLFTNSFHARGRKESFQFDELDIESPISRAELHKLYLDSQVLTVNEVRENLGLEKVVYGDAPLNRGGNVNVSDEGYLEVQRGGYTNPLMPELDYNNIEYDLMK